MARLRDLRRSETDAASGLLDSAASDSELGTGIHPRRGRRIGVRTVLGVAWAGLMLWWMISQRILSPHVLILVGFLTALLFVRDARPMTFVRIFRDWSLVFAWFVGYALSRGAADTLGMPIQEQIWIDIDRVLGFGEVPTLRLQELIDWDAPPGLWEVSLPVMYLSHFMVAFGVLIFLYNRDRVVWGRWYRRFVVLGVLGVIGYILVPSVPPWMSSDTGTIDLVHAGLPRGWEAVQVEWIHQLFEFGRSKANPIAAMPSLHAAFPALLFLFFAPRHGRIVKVLLGFYTLYMAFTIVITGQHWLIDVFAGWAVAYLAHRIMCRAEAWNERRRAAHALASPADPEPDTEPETDTEPVTDADVGRHRVEADDRHGAVVPS